MIRPDFTTRPEAHLRATRDSRSSAEQANPFHGPPTEGNGAGWWLAAAVLLVALAAASTYIPEGVFK